MTYAVSLVDLNLRVRQRSNTENALKFVKDMEVTDYINVGIASIWDLILNSTWGGDRYQSQHVFTTVPGQELYERPSDLYRLLSVDGYVTGNADRPVAIYPYAKEQRNRIAGSVGYQNPWGGGTALSYRWVGENLSLMPVPQSAFDVRLNYAPVAPRLFAPDDSFDSVNGWEEYVVLFAAVRVLTKRGPYDTIPILSGQMEVERQRIKDSAPNADMQQAEGIHILESYDYYNQGYGGYGGGGYGDY